MIVTLGETMLRLSPLYEGERLVNANAFRVDAGGSESNVSVALAMLGHHSRHVTRLPANPLGDRIVSDLRSKGVDISCVVRSGSRVGCYWTEIGCGPRASQVVYDRQGAAFAEWPVEEVPWAQMFSGATWFHMSGITPAISALAATLAAEAMSRVPNTVQVSLDLNYRQSLWTYVGNDEAKRQSTMMALCSRCDMLAGNETDFQDMLGIQLTTSEYAGIAEATFDLFPRLKHIAISLRKSHSATENDWSGVIFLRSGQEFWGPQYQLRSIVDRVGAGDSFCAGIIHGLIRHVDKLQDVIDFATTFSAIKHTLRGDHNCVSEAEVLRVLETGGHGRIER